MSKSHAKSLHGVGKNPAEMRPAVGSSKATVKLLVPAKVKCELSTLSSSDDEVTVTATSKKGLPTFTRSTWSTCFLPTLSHLLASLLDPWDIGNGVDIIVIIQGILDKAYPGSRYQVKFGDKIYSMV
jgi:hypothetical protein